MHENSDNEKPQQHYDSSRLEVYGERFGIQGYKPHRSWKTRSTENIIDAVIDEMGLSGQMWREELENQWADIVGPQLANNTRPGPVEKGNLYVYVRHPIWLQELKRNGEKEILNKVKKQFPHQGIFALRLQIDPEPMDQK